MLTRLANPLLASWQAVLAYCRPAVASLSSVVVQICVSSCTSGPDSGVAWLTACTDEFTGTMHKLTQCSAPGQTAWHSPGLSLRSTTSCNIRNSTTAYWHLTQPLSDLAGFQDRLSCGVGCWLEGAWELECRCALSGILMSLVFVAHSTWVLITLAHLLAE
jgi:hypothetical protein